MAFQKKESAVTRPDTSSNEAESQQANISQMKETSYFNENEKEQDELVVLLEEIPKVDLKQASQIVDNDLFMVRMSNTLKRLNFSELSQQESLDKATSIMKFGEKYGYFLGVVTGAVRAMTTYTKDLDQIKSYLLAEFGFTLEQADKYLEKYCDEYGMPS